MSTKQPKKQPDKTTDVEGQSFMIDPAATRQMTHGRVKDLERSPGERARHKEARPNRQHPH